ncbi:hypothetical protein ACRAWF_31485 [Streptomyces sp. L7]
MITWTGCSSQVDPALVEEAAVGAADDEVAVVARLRPGARLLRDYASSVGSVLWSPGAYGEAALMDVHAQEPVLSLKAARPFGPPGSPAEELALEADDPAPGEEITEADLQPRHPQLDPARGVGSVVAICDWGPDVVLPDFRTPTGRTRFLAVWDQRAGSGAGVGENRFGLRQDPHP